jgi:transglutaminase-like putative cysteine protease
MRSGTQVRLKIRHVTRFDYEHPVTQAHSEIRQTPRDTALQKIISSDVKVHSKVPGHLSWHQDHFDNRVHHFNLLVPHESVEVVAESVVETTNSPYLGQPAPDPRPCLERWAEFVAWSPGVPKLDEYGQVPHRVTMGMTPDAFLAALEALAGYFFDNFRYDPDATHVHSSPQALFEHGGGVCQDMAHAMIGVLRQADVPARYVSGYIFDPKSDEEGQHLRGALATHAWVQVWHPQMGWVGIDPTNNKVADWQYTLMAVGRDYFDVQPVRGVFMGGGEQTLSVSVTVAREAT